MVGDLLVLAVNLLVLVTVVFVGVPLLAVWLLRRARPGGWVGRDRRVGRDPVGRVLTGGGAGLLAVVAVANRSVGALACAVLLLLVVRYRPRRGDVIVRDRGAVLRRRIARIDPSALPGAWARPLRQAVDARRRYGAAVRRSGRGAVRERMADLAADVDRAVLEAHDRARRGAELEAAARAIPRERPSADALRGLVARAAAGVRGPQPATAPPSHPATAPPRPVAVRDERLTAARAARGAARRRLLASAAEERLQLQVLVARLDEACGVAAELALDAPTALPAGAPDAGCELLDRLTALHGALAEATGPR